MLINCKECNLQVSDKAMACPHCGYPLKNVQNIITKEHRRRRLPNGFGQITKLKGYHRNPYRAMVTVGKNINGKPICKLLKPQSYFKTYNEAYLALVEYNKNPYDLDTCITMSELYDKWSEKYFKTLKSDSSFRTIQAAWRYCSSIYTLPVKNIRARHLKTCIENASLTTETETKVASPNIKSRIKSLFNLMFDFAVEYEIADQNYARHFNLGEVIDETSDKGSEKAHMCFRGEELDTLWENKDQYLVVLILVQIYSGWRPQELGLLRVENVDLNNWTFKGGMKTEAGTDRIVPIHPKIREYVVGCMLLQNEFFITPKGQAVKYSDAQPRTTGWLFPSEDGSQLTYDKYAKRFKKVIKSLNLDERHRPHDTRKHFITACKNADVDEYAIKLIVGHAINDVTESVYTERSVDWLHKEIAKIS